MLLNLTKKLCPLMSLALAFGCGKKINEASSSSITRSNQHQDLPSVLTLELAEANSSRSTYKLVRDGVFTLPSKLIAKQGNATGKRVKIFYNLMDDGEYEFHCYYKSLGDSRELPLENCYSSDDRNFEVNAGNIENYLFPMDQDKVIKMELLTPGNGLVIDIVFAVDWK